MKIILDGMGGDNAPASVVEGAVLASKEMEHEIVLIGQQELIEKELKKVIKPYIDEIAKLLTKSKELIRQATKEKIPYQFDFNLESKTLDSYADVVYYKEQLENLKISIKKLEKSLEESLANKSLSNIDNLLKIKETINGMNVIIATTKNYEVPILKQLVDNITNNQENCFTLLANINKDNVNIVCKTNINNPNLHCGNIVKNICQRCLGNGGGNQFFAQGGGSNAKDIKLYLQSLKQDLNKI